MAVLQSIDQCPPFPVVESVEFRHIHGWPGYAAGDDGTIWSCITRWGYSRRWKRLAQEINTKGYKTVRLFAINPNCTRNRKRKTVHVLVCETFHGPRPEGLDCCHNDNSRDNNKADNLRWDTPSSNIMDARRAGTMNYVHMKRRCGEGHPRVKYSSAVIAEIRSLRGVVYYKELAQRYGMHPMHVVAIWNGRARPHG